MQPILPTITLPIDPSSMTELSQPVTIPLGTMKMYVYVVTGDRVFGFWLDVDDTVRLEPVPIDADL